MHMIDGNEGKLLFGFDAAAMDDRVRHFSAVPLGFGELSAFWIWDGIRYSYLHTSYLTNPFLSSVHISTPCLFSCLGPAR